MNVKTISDPTKIAIQQDLNRWYLQNRRDLPWRRTQNPYAIWISEVMLQQTQVKTMLPYYARFMEQFPTVSALADADLQMVLKAWQGLGYYSRARNLHRTAQIVVTRMDGRFPQGWESIRRLPGIGDYIAAAVLSIAFGAPYAVVDGNVKRVMARLLLIDEPANRVAGHKVFRTAAQQLLDVQNAGDHNQAMMELGALVCTPRRPRCCRCPLVTHCRAVKKNLTDRFPYRLKKARTPEHRVVVGAIAKNGNLLVVQRQTHGLLGGLWEFPNARLTSGQDPAKACAAAVRMATGLSVDVTEHIANIRHAYTHFKIHMHVYRCRWQSGVVQLNGPQAFRWVTPEKLADYPIHGAVQIILPHLEANG